MIKHYNRVLPIRVASNQNRLTVSPIHISNTFGRQVYPSNQKENTHITSVLLSELLQNQWHLLDLPEVEPSFYTTQIKHCRQNDLKNVQPQVSIYKNYTARSCILNCIQLKRLQKITENPTIRKVQSVDLSICVRLQKIILNPLNAVCDWFQTLYYTLNHSMKYVSRLTSVYQRGTVLPTSSYIQRFHLLTYSLCPSSIN